MPRLFRRKKSLSVACRRCSHRIGCGWIACLDSATDSVLFVLQKMRALTTYISIYRSLYPALVVACAFVSVSSTEATAAAFEQVWSVRVGLGAAESEPELLS